MRVRQLIEKLAGSTESPRRTAAAFAFGTFLSFSPFVGFQIATGMTVAFLMRLNRGAVFIGLCTNLPWFMIPWYTATTLLGGLLLGKPLAADFSARLSELLALPIYRSLFWERAYDLVAPFFWSFLLGSVLCAIVMGVLAYAVTLPLLLKHRAAREQL
jgi:uncharacterized protein (DUF2062 family)